MKKITIVPMIAVLALGLAACSKTAEPSNVSAVDTNTVVEESDANFSAVDGVETGNSTDLINESETNSTGNAL
jgi:PBP1b-binding outer membrane lipoprotein LpoB